MFSKILRWKKILFDFEPKFTCLLYSEPQQIYTSLKNEGLIDKMIHGYPNYEEISKILKPYKKQGSILIIDDGLNAVTHDLAKIFFQLSHHANSTIIFGTLMKIYMKICMKIYMRYI